MTWYFDGDADGFGDPDEATVEGSTVQSGYSMLPYDCADHDPMISPVASERCNGRDDDCDGTANFVIGVNDWEDDDLDGFPDASCAGGDPRADCDDRDPNAYMGAPERCDGRDNDCDGAVDEGCARCNPGNTAFVVVFDVSLLGLPEASGGSLAGTNLDGRVTLSETDPLGCYHLDYQDPVDGERGVDAISSRLKSTYESGLDLADLDEAIAIESTPFVLSIAGLDDDPARDSCVTIQLGTTAPTVTQLHDGRFQVWTHQELPVWLGGPVALREVVIEGTLLLGPVLEGVVVSGRVEVGDIVSAFVEAAPSIDPELVENTFEGATDLPPVRLDGQCTALSHVFTAEARRR